MGDLGSPALAAGATAPGGETKPVASRAGNWRPIVTLLLLSPAIGELLSGSSPPLQFFNPIFLLLLVGLYGCGALLVREVVARRGLNAVGLLLLGAAYAVVEEGLTCKSFFNPYWTDTGYLSIYGRAWGVNWVWTCGLTLYHAMASITVPIFLTHALFAQRAATPWLGRRGTWAASLGLLSVTFLGFLGFDNRQFHLIELQDPLGLARQLDSPRTPLAAFMVEQFQPKHRAMLEKAGSSGSATPELRYALLDELNRLLTRADLYTPERFAGIPPPENTQPPSAKAPKGDDLVRWNRNLLEQAFPRALAVRTHYPFRPAWPHTLGCLAAISALVVLALRSPRRSRAKPVILRPWLTGLFFTASFVAFGFVMPGLVEHGLPMPAALTCAIWGAIAVLLARTLLRLEAAEDGLWRCGLWALGVISPWVLVAILLGVSVQMLGAKSFSGMSLVALAFGTGILLLARRWVRRLAPPAAAVSGPAAGVAPASP